MWRFFALALLVTNSVSAAGLSFGDASTGRSAASPMDAAGKTAPLQSLRIESVVVGSQLLTMATFHFRPLAQGGEFRLALPENATYNWFFGSKYKDNRQLTRGEGNSYWLSLSKHTSEFSVTYSQDLPSQPESSKLLLSLGASTQALEVTVTREDGSPLVPKVQLQGDVPHADLFLDLADESRPSPLRSSKGSQVNAAPLSNVIFLVDTSASVGPSLHTTIETLRLLLARASSQVAVVAFDQTATTYFVGPPQQLSNSVLASLGKRGALGATDLPSALRAIAKLATAHAFRRVVLLGDGLSPIADRGLTSLRNAAARLRQSGIERFDVVLSSSIRDINASRTLAQSVFPLRGQVVVATDGEETLWQLLQSTAAAATTKRAAPRPKPFEIVDGKVSYFEPGHRHSVPRTRYSCGFVISGRLPPEAIRRTVRLNYGRFRACYHRGLLRDPHLAGRVQVRFIIGRGGQVTWVGDQGSTLKDREVTRCVLDAFTQLEFPIPPGGPVTVVYPLALSKDGEQVTEDPPQLPAPFTPVELTNPEYSLIPRAADLSAFTGEYAAIRATLAQGDKPAALKQAQQYLDDNAGELLPLLALGEAAEENRDFDLASRAYGSLVDLFSQDPQIQRIAAQRLSHLSVPSSQALAREIYRQFLSNHEGWIDPTRELAYLMTQMGDPARAFELLTRLLDSHPDDAPGELLKRDLGIIAKVLLVKEPGRHVAVEKALRLWGIKLNSKPSHLFVVSTALGKDVEFQIYAAPNRGRLDGTQLGYLSFDFAVDGVMHQAPYTLRVRSNPATFYSAFDMLPKIGQVHLISHDGKGHLSVEGRPFIFLHSPAEIDLGQYGVAPLEPDATPSLRASQ